MSVVVIAFHLVIEDSDSEAAVASEGIRLMV